MMRRHLTDRQRGFTIIELMIATAILSTMLIMVTALMINIGNLYYKGINQALVQNDARSITDDVAGNLKFNDQAPIQLPPSAATHYTAAYCIGSTRYTYVLGVKIGETVGGSTYQHVLWRDQIATPDDCFNKPANLTSATPSADPNGTEMISPNSRLSVFCIGSFTAPSTCNPSTSPYDLAVGVAAGDTDLLTNPTPLANNWDTICNGAKVGHQFCSTARLQTSVVQRFQSSYIPKAIPGLVQRS